MYIWLFGHLQQMTASSFLTNLHMQPSYRLTKASLGRRQPSSIMYLVCIEASLRRLQRLQRGLHQRLPHSCVAGVLVQIEQLQGQCCQLEKELARKQGDADVFRREAENKLAERMRVALREQQLEYESQVIPARTSIHVDKSISNSNHNSSSCTYDDNSMTMMTFTAAAVNIITITSH